MRTRGFKPKVAQLDQVKLDFPDIDDDPNLKEAAEELKRKGQEINKGDLRKRKFEETGPPKNPEQELAKRPKMDSK